MTAMRPIIKVENLSKRYRIGKREHYRTLRDSVAEAALAPVRAIASLFSTNGNRNGADKEDVVWALDGVSFEVMPSEVVGVIGRNGAGKSTLLKILSRITEPTQGRVELYGRVGSLLEVGTGFHQELTGGENIFLSGAILGMRRAEIARKFDEIVAFAEIDQFIDTPVKRYSSGMYVRLAFAVAAHLEPEILLVDEVLAVGDAAFQKRCLGKMGDVAREGRTVLFVSHNMASIEALCSSCLYIRGGRLLAKGEPEEMVSRYMANDLTTEGASRSLIGHPGRRGNSIPMLTTVDLLGEDGTPTSAVRMGSSLSLKVSFNCDSQPLSPALIVTVKNAHQAPVFAVSNKYNTNFLFPERVTAGTIVCTLERLPLMPGTYYLDLSFGSELIYNLDEVHEAISFDVTPADVFGSGKLPPAISGPVFWPAKFELLTS
jgi:lipopolysaccharide transport system ATP-binding protein